MSDMIARIVRHEWADIDGVFCAVVTGQNDDGTEQKIAIPVMGLPTLAGEARRRSMAMENNAQPHANGALASALLLPVQSSKVATTDSGTVALILDPGLDTEMQYQMSPEDARGLSAGLIEEAAKAEDVASEE
jgi:hypothetical protein